MQSNRNFDNDSNFDESFDFQLRKRRFSLIEDDFVEVYPNFKRPCIGNHWIGEGGPSAYLIGEGQKP